MPEGAVRAVCVVVCLVLAEDRQEVALIPDQRAVEQFPAAATDPALRDRVRAGRLDWAAQDPDPGTGEHRVEGSGELTVSVAEQEFP